MGVGYGDAVMVLDSTATECANGERRKERKAIRNSRLRLETKTKTKTDRHRERESVCE